MDLLRDGLTHGDALSLSLELQPPLSGRGRNASATQRKSTKALWVKNKMQLMLELGNRTIFFIES